MKKICPGVLALVLSAASASAAPLTASGVFDSTVKLGADADGGFMYGLEEYANMRIRGKIGDTAVFYGAFNCIASSGMLASALTAAGGTSVSDLSRNYAAAIELERLYFHIANERTGIDAGLMRLAFGYGSVFSPSDFFNPKNPLYPDARPRAILGGVFSFYTDDDSNARTFAAAPSNPFSTGGGEFRMGFSGERHFRNVSVQGLYTFESPSDGSAEGVHYLGASAKGDAFVGLWMDMMCGFNPASHQGERWRELSASAGFDYSLADAHLYFLCEYLFNGSYSVTAASAENPGGYRNSHYLYGMSRYNVSDFTSVSLAVIFAVDDASFTPIAAFSSELFQGMRITITAQSPLDRAAFISGSDDGELGPVRSGAAFLFTVKAELRF
jgi:hypothetical protein